eukprot:s3454_g2.t1
MQKRRLRVPRLHCLSRMPTKQRKKACLLNRALCLNKAGYFKRAVQACDLVLDMEPSNEKGLFRRAEAFLGLDDCASALRDIKVLPGASRELTQLRDKVRRRQKQLDSDAQELFAKCRQLLGWFVGCAVALGSCLTRLTSTEHKDRQCIGWWRTRAAGARKQRLRSQCKKGP